MAAIAQSETQQVKRLYERGQSAREIAERLDVPIHAVYRFLRRHDIPRRSSRESNALLFQRRPPTFKLKLPRSRREEHLRIAGAMLYWAEGSNRPQESFVDFVNSNPDMVRLFVTFLRRVCGVSDHRLRAFLYCYANQNPQSLTRFWSRLTGIPATRFSRPYVRKDFRREKVGRVPYGVVHVRYFDKKLLLTIQAWIREIFSTLVQPSRVGGGVDNRIGL